MTKNFSIALILLSILACKSPDPEPIILKDLAFVVSGGSKTVEVIDLQKEEVIKTYSITNKKDRFPHHIYLSADQTKLAIANPAYDFSEGLAGLHGKQIEGGLVVLDAATGKKIHDIDVPYANHNAVFSPDDSEIWTAGFSHSGRAYVINSSNAAILSEVQFDSDPSELFFTEDGQYAVVRSGESTFLQFMDINSREVVKAVKVDLSTGNAWPGYDDLILVSNTSHKSVNFVDSKTFKVVDFIDFDFFPGFLIYNKLTSELWICDSPNNQIHVFKKTNGVWSETSKMDFPNADPHMIKFYYNFSKALVVNQKGNSAVFIDVVSKTQKKTIPMGEKPNGIALIAN
jgi:DNA-binding beta-propeller fold protein YncE